MTTTDLRERVLQLAAAERAPTRAEVRRTTWLVLVAAATVAATTFALAGGMRPTGRPVELLLATALLSMAIAAGASWIALRRGVSTDGRSRETLVALILVVPLALIIGKLALSSGWENMMEPWPDRPGFRCLALFLGIAAAPLAAYLWIWRLRDVPRPGLQGSAIGVAAGAGAWALVDLWCPVAHPGHLLLGHLLPLALLVTSGMVWRLVRRH